MNRSVNYLNNCTTLIMNTVKNFLSRSPLVFRQSATEARSFFNIPQIQSPISSISYKPTLWLNNQLAQTVYNATLSSSDILVNYERDTLALQDKGSVTLDWHPNICKGRPLIFIMHGLTGGSQLNYIKAIVLQARRKGFNAVAFNSRGVNAPLTSPMPFSGHDFEDILTAMNFAQEKAGTTKIYGIGLSFGSNVMTRFIAKFPYKLYGYVGISTPFDVQKSLSAMPIYYQRFFLRRYINECIDKQQQVKIGEQVFGYNIASIKKSKNLRQYHERYTCKIINRSVQDLFKSFLIDSQLIKDIRTPSLFIQAQDDLIVPANLVPLQQLRMNSSINYLQTKEGSHLCWFEGRKNPRRWYPKVAIRFMQLIN